MVGHRPSIAACIWLCDIILGARIRCWKQGVCTRVTPRIDVWISVLQYDTRFIESRGAIASEALERQLRNSSRDENTRTWPDLLSVYLLTLIHKYPLNRKQFRFSGYLWINVNKYTDNMSHHFRVFSSRNEFLASKSKSKYLSKACNKRIRTVQCGYMQYRINTKTWRGNL